MHSEFCRMRFPVSNFLHLFFPHNCAGCGSDILSGSHFLCVRCLHTLPETFFFQSPANPVEKIFYGRLPVVHAAAAYYFTKESLLQYILIQLKYRNNNEAGYFLGRMMGYALLKADRFKDVDVLVPLPLNDKKEFLRGYNQAKIICEGISEIWHKPILSKSVERTRFTETQTHQNRTDRWQNMEGVFKVTDIPSLRNKHILLIDDVITTGATLEACGSVILGVEGVRLSIGAAAFTI